MSESNGGSCGYYRVIVKDPWDGSDEYDAECGEIAEALNLTVFESNIFKEIWRGAKARQGAKKKGNTALRGAQKIVFFSNRILKSEERKA